MHLQKGSPSTSRHLLNLVQTCKIIYIIKIQHQTKASARIEEQLPKKTLNIFERKGFSTEPEGGKLFRSKLYQRSIRSNHVYL